MAEQPLVEGARADPEEPALAVGAAHAAGAQVAAVDGAADCPLAAAHPLGGLRDRQVLDREALPCLGPVAQLQLLVTHLVTSCDGRRASGRHPDADVTPPHSLS